MTPIRAVLSWIAIPVLTLTLTACDHAEAPGNRTPSASTSAPQTAPSSPARGEHRAIRDLAIDESLGGHTLRYVQGRPEGPRYVVATASRASA